MRLRATVVEASWRESSSANSYDETLILLSSDVTRALKETLILNIEQKIYSALPRRFGRVDLQSFVAIVDQPTYTTQRWNLVQRRCVSFLDHSNLSIFGMGYDFL